MKEFVKKILKKSSLGKCIYPLVQSVYQWYSIPIKRRRLRRVGVEALMRIHSLLMDNKIDYYLQFGSLLGVIRDKDFIKHDDDIDLTVVDPLVSPQNVLRLLLENDFHFIHALKVNEYIVDFAVSYKKLTVDFFFPIPVEREHKVGICCAYFNPSSEYERYDQNNYRVWFIPDNIRTKITRFKGIDLKIPQDPEWLIEYIYGENWRNPIKNWSPKSITDHFQEMDDFAIRVTDVERILGRGGDGTF